MHHDAALTWRGRRPGRRPVNSHSNLWTQPKPSHMSSHIATVSSAIRPLNGNRWSTICADALGDDAPKLVAPRGMNFQDIGGNMCLGDRTVRQLELVKPDAFLDFIKRERAHVKYIRRKKDAIIDRISLWAPIHHSFACKGSRRSSVIFADDLVRYTRQRAINQARRRGRDRWLRGPGIKIANRQAPARSRSPVRCRRRG